MNLRSKSTSKIDINSSVGIVPLGHSRFIKKGKLIVLNYKNNLADMLLNSSGSMLRQKCTSWKLERHNGQF
jgi:hypothetical protein